MDWCGSSMPRTLEYRTMNEERHERKTYWLVIVRYQFLTGEDTKSLCPSIPWIDREGGQGIFFFFWFFHVVKELNNGSFMLSKSWTMKIDGKCLIELIGSCRNKVQVYRSIRMFQLHTSLHFHLTPIVMINNSSRRDLLFHSKTIYRFIPVGVENPSLSQLCYQSLWDVGIGESSSWGGFTT